MAKWTSLGHAMRRRMGAPSSHLESAGTSMARNVPTPEEIIASAAHSKSPRRYMGQDADQFTNVSAQPGNTISAPRKNVQAGDPTIADKANRKNVLAGSAAQSERMGAKYSVSQKFPAGTEPAAAATMANARVIPSVMGRQAPNFTDEMNRSY
jgi:hypothetical protein